MIKAHGMKWCNRDEKTLYNLQSYVAILFVSGRRMSDSQISSSCIPSHALSGMVYNSSRNVVNFFLLTILWPVLSIINILPNSNVFCH